MLEEEITWTGYLNSPFHICESMHEMHTSYIQTVI